MATWKKVIVSGSDGELNTLFTSAHITASGIISASSRLFGGLNEGEHDEVIIYDTATGELKYKVLSLINTVTAPRLFAIDFNANNNTDFRLSHAPGNTSLIGSSIYPYIQLSASVDSGGSVVTYYSASNTNYVGLNDIWDDRDITNQLYFTAATNITSSISGARDGLNVGSTITDRALSFQATDNTNTAVPGYDTNASYLNFGARAFNDGGIGKLEFYVNDNTSPQRTFNLETNLGVISNNLSDGITINLFATQSNLDSTTGDSDPVKHYRSGSFIVESSIQRDGYNYCYVIHTGSKDGTEFAYITNFAEWFYDIEGANDDLSITEQPSLIDYDAFNAISTSSISGIKFFDTNAGNNARFRFGAKCINQYKNIYPTTNGITFNVTTTNTIPEIQLTQSGQYADTSDSNYEQIDTSISSTNNFTLVKILDTAGANTNDTTITASIKIDFPSSVFHQPSDFIITPWGDLSNGADAAFNIDFDHIPNHKGIDEVTSNTVTIDDYLVNTLSEYSNEYEYESFRGETYRIQSGTYANTTDFSAGTADWDGEENIINGTDGHNKGLVQYYSHLVYPTASGDGGVYTTTYGPDNQPDYSGASGVREYYRYFKLVISPINQPGGKEINIELLGSGKLVSSSHTTHFGSGDNDAFNMYIWRDNTGGANSLFGQGEWVDVFQGATDGSGPYSGNTLDNLETQYIPIPSSTSNINYNQTTSVGGKLMRNGVARVTDAATANTFQVGDNIAVKIVVPENWTGYLNALLVQFGGTTSRINSEYSSTL